MTPKFEYQNVIVTTSQFPLMKEAAFLPISPRDVFRLRDEVCDMAGVSYIAVHIRGKGAQYRQVKKGWAIRVSQYPFDPEHPTVGRNTESVLHELAHFIQWEHNGRRLTKGEAHGHEFVDLLDELLVWWKYAFVQEPYQTAPIPARPLDQSKVEAQLSKVAARREESRKRV